MPKLDRYTVHTIERIWFRHLLKQPGTPDSMPKLSFVSEIEIT